MRKIKNLIEIQCYSYKKIEKQKLRNKQNVIKMKNLKFKKHCHSENIKKLEK